MKIGNYVRNSLSLSVMYDLLSHFDNSLLVVSTPNLKKTVENELRGR
jgi:hypothetical protein